MSTSQNESGALSELSFFGFCSVYAVTCMLTKSTEANFCWWKFVEVTWSRV